MTARPLDRWTAGPFIVLIFAVLFGIPAFAEVKFKDVPAKHWAAKSVYELVKLGITNGYPDGTFRGAKSITRFETAIFLSKLAEKMGAGDAAQIKEDLNNIKNDIAALKKSGSPIAVSGAFEANTTLTNLMTTKGISGKGPIVYYRLKTGMAKDLNESASLKVNFDTMDSGFYGAQRDLVREMIDVEGDLKLNPVDLGLLGDILFSPVNIKFTEGPGIVQHTDLTGLLPSENGICYIRPYTGFNVSSKLADLSVAGSYLLNNYDRQLNGKVDTNYGSLALAYDFTKMPNVKNLQAKLNAGFYSKNPGSGGPRDSKFSFSLLSEINQKLSASALLVVGKPETKGWLAGARINFLNVIEGMSLSVGITKVGTEFIPQELATEELGETGFDAFMRPLENSTSNIDVDLTQTISERLLFKAKGAFRLSPDFGYGPDKAKSRQTMQAGFSYLPASDANIDLYYRVNQDPIAGETTDLSTIGVNYKF
ncbi:MAG: S-layer homology domain-containing protein [Candidatus Margulisiibacteriota bacterium]